MVKSVGVIGTFAVCVGILIARQDAVDAVKKKEATVRTLMAAMNADQIGAQVLEQMGQQFSKIGGGQMDGFWKKFQQKVRPQELVEMVVPIYAKYFEQADVEQLLAFYESPIGKKFVEIQPKLMKESMEAGAEWGKRLATEAMKEWEEERTKDGK